MDSNKIANFIKKIRNESNLTQQDFANKYGVTYQAVSKWENGKNFPDLMILRKMCKDYNYSIDELLDVNTVKKIKAKKMFWHILLFGITLCIFIVILFVLYNYNKKTYDSKSISSMCKEFNIVGNIAYDKNKSSIYIYKVDYCGKPDNTKYKKINCTLYEKSNGKDKKVKECKSSMNNVTLNEYLEDVSIIIDDYNQTCRNMSDYKLFLKIIATETDDKIITYNIPLSLSDSCKK